jgi:predicted MPP superfamily phosphohydrolase
VTLAYNLILFAADAAALRLVRRRGNLATWGGATVAVGLLAVLAGLALAGFWEGHFGVFRLWAYGVFLHGPIWLIGSAVLGWQTHRRLAMVAVLAAGLIGLFAGYAFLIEPFRLDVSYVRLAHGKIRRPVRIVVIADFQTDRIGDYERSVLRRVRKEEPDIILWAGDYLQVPWRQWVQFREEFRSALREIGVAAPQGVFAVQGNVDPPSFGEIFEGMDVTTVLSTQSFQVGEIQLTCLSLRDSANASLRVENPASERFHVVLGHVPNFALGAIHGDLLVAGHTHGGQVRIPFWGPVTTHSCIPNAWAAGMTELSGGRRLLVSRGIGMERHYAPRLRFNCRPELVVLELVPESP